MEATMFANGSQIPRLRTFPAYALKVGSMSCIRPLEGVPFRALMSQVLMALGFPSDSWFILRRRELIHEDGDPVCDSARSAVSRHRATPAPPALLLRSASFRAGWKPYTVW